MYGSTPVTITGTASGSAIGAQSQAVKENTQLETHLQFLRGLHEELGGAANRAMQLADRLIGQEPANISKGSPDAKDAHVLPMLARLERAAMEAKELVMAIHYHLNRLERL